MFSIIGYSIALGIGMWYLIHVGKKEEAVCQNEIDMLNRYKDHLCQKIQSIKGQIQKLEEQETSIGELFVILEKVGSYVSEQDILKKVRTEIHALGNIAFSFKRSSGIVPAPRNEFVLYSESPHKLALHFDQIPSTLRNVMDIFVRQLNVCLEISSLYKYYQKLAISDTLTGTFNKRYFLEKYEFEFERSQKRGTPLSLIMLDIDDFKKYNDTYGHLCGDMILKEVAEVVKGTIRGVDVLSRYGGEEFCIILPETDLKHAAQAAERIRQNVNQMGVRIKDEMFHNVTVSVGIASYPRNTVSAQELLDVADDCLYYVKNHGKNQIHYCTGAVMAGEVSHAQ